MISRRLVLSILGSLAFPWLTAGAAPPIQATAQATRTTVQVGEPVRITIQVRDSDEIPQIDAPRIEGMSISSTGAADVTPSALRNARALPTQRLVGTKLLSSLRDVSKQLNDLARATPNGADPQLSQQYQEMLKQRLGNLGCSDYSIVYLATPEKIGSITVPPFTVHSSGQTVQTQPLRLNVIEPKPSPWVKAALSLSNPQPTAGDTVNLYVDLLVRRWVQQVGRDKANLKSQPISHVTLTVPSLDGYQEVQPLESLEQFVRKRRLPPGQLGYHVNHFPGVILLEQEPAATSERLDPQWYRRRLTLPFRAEKAGTMEVPPLRVAGEVYVPSTGKDRYTWEGFVASSSPLKFRILEARDLSKKSVAARFQRAEESQNTTDRHVENVPSQPTETSPEAAHGSANLRALAAAVAVFLVTAPVAIVLRRRLAGRRQHVALVSRQWQAIEDARQRLRKSPATAAAVSTAVQDFLRAHLELAPGEITPEEAVERLHQAGYALELSQTCAAVLRACAARQYAPSPTRDERDITILALTAERLMNEIIENKRNAPLNTSVIEDALTRERQAALAD